MIKSSRSTTLGMARDAERRLLQRQLQKWNLQGQLSRSGPVLEL